MLRRPSSLALLIEIGGPGNPGREPTFALILLTLLDQKTFLPDLEALEEDSRLRIQQAKKPRGRSLGISNGQSESAQTELDPTSDKAARPITSKHECVAAPP